VYQAETILKLKEPREDDEFPYNRVEVVGPSPVHHSTRSAEWVGSNGEGVIIKPAGGAFGSALDEPFGKLQQLYDVESLPEQNPQAEAPQVRVITPETAGPSPEDQFADLAAEQGEDTRRAKPPEPVVSPLDGEVQPQPSSSPLDQPPVRGAEEEVAPTASERPDDLDVGA
jgi:hypothetical protein